MRLFDGLDAIPDGFGPSAVAIGKFDGFHRGHRAVLEDLTARATREALPTAVVTFDRNPLSILRPEACPPALVSSAQKVELLAASGVDATLMIAFTQEFSEVPADEFVRQVLVDRLAARVVYAGRDFRFGARGEGDIEVLRALGSEHGFEVVVHDDVTVADETGEERRTSSTWVRDLLGEGRVRDARALLGRSHRIRSTVVHGEQRGRELGYPTANLSPEIEGMLPADGVYAAWALADGERYGAAVSIGNNPTFDGIPQHQVEAHLLDQKLDLYDRPIELEFVEFIRSMHKFDSVESLVAQMNADELRIRKLLAADAETGLDPAPQLLGSPARP